MDGLVEDNRKIYQKGDKVWIAGTISDNSYLREVEVFMTFEDECGLQYVLRYFVPGIGDVVYEVRDWETIGETEHGPLNMWTEARMSAMAEKVRRMFQKMREKHG